MQEAQEQPKEPEGVIAKRRTIVGTSVTGIGATTVAALASHGPAGLFFGAVGTAIALALEWHGTPEEYERYISPAMRAVGRWINRGNAAPKDVIYVQGSVDAPIKQPQPKEVTQVYDDGKMEDLQPKPTLELTDEEMDEGLAYVMVPTRHEEAQEVDGSVRSIFGSDPRRRLMMAENFQPDADAPLATGVAAFGLPGSGKTTTIVRFFEQYVEQFRLPFVAFDSQGDFKSLIESGLCPRGVIATPGNLPSMVSVIKHRLQVVIDLSEWREQGRIEMSYELAAQVIAASIRGLMATQKAIESRDRLPCLVGLDEAQLWVPEGASGLISRETQQSIKSVVMALATTGRKLGVVPFVAGPRIAQIDKDAIAGIETRLFGKADLDNDIKRYREYIPVKEVSDQQIRQLGQGDLIVSMNGQRLLVHFYNRATVHTSHTPRVSRALAQMTSALPVETLAQITRIQETTREEEKQTDPRLPAAQVRRHVSVSAYDARKKQLRDRRMPVRVQGTPGAQGRHSGDMGASRETAVVDDRLSPELRRAYDAFENQMSYRDLGAKLDVSKDTAGKWYQRLRDLGYIGKDGMRLV